MRSCATCNDNRATPLHCTEPGCHFTFATRADYRNPDMHDCAADWPCLATVPEVAQMLAVTEQTVHRWISTGRLRLAGTYTTTGVTKLYSPYEALEVAR